MAELGWDGLEGPIATAIERLLPARYAPFRPLVLDGLRSFLRALPEQRRAEIAARQAALPSDTTIGHRLTDLLRTSPLLHKLGQTLARNRRLDPALRGSLQQLESLPPSLAIEAVRPVLSAALATDDEDGKLVPLAEGSVAIVASGVGRTRDGGRRVPAVFKTLKPGIEQRLAEDLAAWPVLAEELESRARVLGVPDLAWRETLDQVRDLMLAEVDLGGEQRNLDAAATFYRGDRRVTVPLLLEGCGPRVTAMTRIAGVQVTAVAHPHLRRRAARTTVDALIARPLFSVGPVLVHGDPHAGNLVWTPDGRLGILDWALAARIDPRSLALTAAIVLAALRLDRRGVMRALGSLARDGGDRSALERVAAEAVAQLARGAAPQRWTLDPTSGAADALPGLGWLTTLLDRAALEAGARFDDDLLLLRKSLLTLDGVVRDLAAGHPIALDLALAATGRLFEEWPRRLIASPFSRDFATHLSNLDLVSLWWLVPTRARNAWRAM
jgi:ubiquinone biosynthesis protein